MPVTLNRYSPLGENVQVEGVDLKHRRVIMPPTVFSNPQYSRSGNQPREVPKMRSTYSRKTWAGPATLCCVLGGFLTTAPSPALAQEISFRNDVMAVLSKGGCNAGTCHGNKNGKGGFKLSLRGQEPDLDYLALTRDYFARRINALDAEQSLVLLKPTTQVPHEGGERFKKGSDEYRI